MSGELLPCPFCGATETASKSVQIENEGWRCQIECDNCGAMGPPKSDADRRATAWNARMTTQQDSVDVERLQGRFWLIVHEPGMVPERKGSWPVTDTAKVLREFIAARPAAYLHVLTIGPDGVPDVSHGPEVLQMLDGRSMSVGRKHNARTLAAHTAALSLPITQRDEQGERNAAVATREACAKVAEQSAAYFRDFAVANGASDEGAEAARIACEDLATAIRRLSIEQGDQDGGER